eukprot:TRINITY_DN13649_c0_g1_i2.p1 TRINITY_DN13649_c0_g1~~TRINITY_DN13649_c0_g1_i2.p1  ORF type:complete len:224 (-),score=61.31 TRINITY_DN13649_c0_g1_i2:365-1036(-)
MAVSPPEKKARPAAPAESCDVGAETAAGADAASSAGAACAEDQQEWRIDEADGCAYILDDFLVEYGGTREEPPEEWKKSRLATADEVELAKAALEGADDAEGEQEDEDDDEDEEEEDDDSEHVASLPAPSWLPAFDLSGESGTHLSSTVDCMRCFGLSVEEADVGPETLAILPDSELHRRLRRISEELKGGAGVALVRGIPWPKDKPWQRVLLLALCAGLAAG